MNPAGAGVRGTVTVGDGDRSWGQFFHGRVWMMPGWVGILPDPHSTYYDPTNENTVHWFPADKVSRVTTVAEVDG